MKTKIETSLAYAIYNPDKEHYDLYRIGGTKIGVIDNLGALQANKNFINTFLTERYLKEIAKIIGIVHDQFVTFK